MQIEMFKGTPEHPPLFVVQGHFDGSYKRLTKTLSDYIFASWFGFLITTNTKETCVAHGEVFCKELRCMVAKLERIPGGVCHVCNEEVNLVRHGSLFVASTTCVGRPPRPPRSAPRKPGPGVVYFIHDPSNGAVKIGYTSSDPMGRMRQLQVGHPTRLGLGSAHEKAQ